MKKIFSIIVIILLIINVIVGSLLLFDIQILKSPKTKVTISLLEINPDEILLQTSIEISNSNPFDLIVNNLGVNTTIKNGSEVLNLHIDGGDIPSQGNRTFSSSDTIAFHGNFSDILLTTVKGTLGINILGFLKKTLPIEITVVTSLGDVLKSITAPVIHLESVIHQIVSDGIIFSGNVTVDNPNTIEMSAENITLVFTTENGTNIGNLVFSGGIIPAKGSSHFNVAGKVGFQVLNPEVLSIKLEGTIGVRAAGVTKKIPFSVDATILIPSLSDLLADKNPINLSLIGNLKLTVKGLRADVELKIYNPYVLAVTAQDLVCSLSRVDKNVSHMLGTTNMTSCLTEAGKTSCLDGQIIVPFTTLFFSGGRRLIPDYYQLTLQGNFSFVGIHHSLPLSLNAYLDPHLFR